MGAAVVAAAVATTSQPRATAAGRGGRSGTSQSSDRVAAERAGDRGAGDRGAGDRGRRQGR